MTIWAHTIVCNEDKFVWFAIMSVIDYVDKVMVWDTGSTDDTVKIIQEIQKLKGDKILFKEVGPVDRNGLTMMRQRMLEETDADWFILVDGDEVWWDDSIKKLVEAIKEQGNKKDAIVVPFYNPLGDIYHYQDESASRYQIANRKGNFQVRAINKKIPGLHVKNSYPLEGYYNNRGQIVQESDKLLLLDAPYFHATHLRRSSELRKYNKYKFELGKHFSRNFKYPEIFFRDRPSFIPSALVKRSKIYVINSLLRAPLIHIKRKVLKK